MRHVQDLSKGILGAPDSDVLWTEIINYIPDEVLLKPNVKILNVACGHGTEADIIAGRMIALGKSKEEVRDSIYVLDKYHVFTNQMRLKGYKHVITADFLTWEPDMEFDVVVGNPPYNGEDTSRMTTSHRGQGENLAKKFALKSIELSNRYIFFIMPYGHRTYSSHLAERYKSNGLYRIDSCEEYFKDVATNPCVFYFDKTKEVSEVEDNYYTHDIEVPSENIGCIFRNQPGTLNRIDYEHTLSDEGKYKVVVTTGVVKYTDDENLVRRMKDNTRGKWRVVFNCTTSVGHFGKIIIAEPEAVLSKSVHCLLLNSEEEALEMKKYLESEKATNILKKVKTVNACNSKKFLQYIPMPTST